MTAPEQAETSVDPKLLEILVCPLTRRRSNMMADGRS